MPDADLAAKLSDLQLMERLSGAQLAHWKSTLGGEKSQRAWTGLADRSAFLAPPANEIPAKAAPDLAEQRRIMGLAAVYVSKAIPQLPKFYATRTITHFEDAPGSAEADSPNDGGALHAMRISHATVLYRDGEEVAEPGPVKVDSKVHAPDRGLKTWGVFGPILGLVLLDAAQSKLAWGHWEQGANGPVAVFSYAVPKDKSHYEVRYCCVASAYGLESNSFQEMSGYHGEISVDPTTGTIVRLTVNAELEPKDPILRAAAVVDYGPVELGGTTYICPQRSVSIAVAKTIKQVKDPSGRSYPTMGPPQMLLNDADFRAMLITFSAQRLIFCRMRKHGRRVLLPMRRCRGRRRRMCCLRMKNWPMRLRQNRLRTRLRRMPMLRRLVPRWRRVCLSRRHMLRNSRWLRSLLHIRFALTRALWM